MAIIRKLTSLVNVRDTDKAYDVYIGRGSPWGNPFRIGKDGDRAEVVALHMHWLNEWIENKNEIRINKQSNKWIIEHLNLLKDKVLGCYCWPLLCHGDNYINILKEKR